MYADLPLDQLRTHRTATPQPAGLREFWTSTLAESRAAAVPPEAVPARQWLRSVTTTDVRFSGFGGDRVAAWLHRPAQVDAAAALPCVVQYIGYGGARGLAHEQVLWADAGYAHLVMDTRGQGAAHGSGTTPDDHGSGPAYPGYLTRGILDPRAYYYRRLMTDAALAVDAARALPGIDPARVIVAGGSQGGALAVAAAALSEGLVGALVDVPFLSDIMRAVSLTDEQPYAEIRHYLSGRPAEVETVATTLALHDASQLAGWANAPALFSVGLMDEICPPSTVYAAYNAWAGPKQILEYAFNGHEGGGPAHVEAQLAWLADLLG